MRIEDTDVTRCRPEFTQLIFEDLAWLGISWEEPVRIQSEHFADYHQNLGRLRALALIYPCFCSRRQAHLAAASGLDPDGQPLYGGTCRRIPAAVADERIAAGAIHGWRIDMARCGDDQASVWGDALIAKERVGSSYHIAVVTDDALQGVTHVVRGKDMEAATSLHRLLQRLLDLPHPEYFHHELIRDEEGQKLSKSLKSTGLGELRAQGVTPYDIRRRLGLF